MTDFRQERFARERFSSGAQSAELFRLVSRMCDGGIGADELSRLEGLLRGDPAARISYYRFVELHGELSWTEGLLASNSAGGARARSMLEPAAHAAIGPAGDAAIGPVDESATGPADNSASAAAAPAVKSAVLGFLNSTVDYVNHSRVLLFSLVAVMLSGWFAFQLASVLLGAGRRLPIGERCEAGKRDPAGAAPAPALRSPEDQAGSKPRHWLG